MSRKHPHQIERHVADAFWGGIDHGALPTCMLVVGDLDAVIEERCRILGRSVNRWCRWTVGHRVGCSWPQASNYLGATFRIPKEKASFDFYLHGIASNLASGMPLWIYGANDEGIRSVSNRLVPLFENIHTIATRRHCRVIKCQRTTAEAKSTFDALASSHTLTIFGEPLRWHSYPGVFAEHKLDSASELLMSYFPSDLGARDALDFCCGTGVLTKALHLRNPQCRLHALDADVVSLDAARLNIPDATFYASDGWTGLPDGQFDLIVSNPPIHRGKVEDRRILRSLVTEAPTRLRPGGKLLLVVQKRTQIGRDLRTHFKNADRLANDGRFEVWMAQ